MNVITTERKAMDDKKAALIERAEKVVAEITRLMEEPSDHSDAGTLVSRLLDYVAEGDRELSRDRYIRRFVFDAAQMVAARPWEKESDIYGKLPPYGFRRDEERLQWAHWFGSLRKRALLVNRFLIEVQGTQIRQSVYDMMFETFRYEQNAVAAKVVRYLADDANWR